MGVDVNVDIIKLPDGGYCLSIVASETGRELELVWTSSYRYYERQYFVARTDSGRDAGIVRNPRGIASLLQWVTGWQDLGGDGLEVANVLEKKE